MGFRDVVLFFFLAGTNLQWVATAAAAGPGSIAVWILGFAAMFVPLAYAVVGLSSRYPQEGGLYVWSRRAFGDLAGFLTGWTYWSSNLPYFPGVLYFAVSSALVIGGEPWKGASDSPLFFVVAAVAGLSVATALNILGLSTGKWLTNAGAVARWTATLVLVGLGAAVWWRFGSATQWSAASLAPGFHFRDVVFWSTIAFAWTGLESASFMGEEIDDSRRSVPRAIFAASPFIAACYVLGTIAILVILPAGQVTGLEAVMQAFESGSRRLGLPAITPVAAALVALSALGSVGAWLAAVARIPFVAGLDHFLPEGFGRLHPRWGSPYAALLTQAAVTVVFIVLGQAGTTVRGAYDVLISMTVIATFIPFLFIFAAAARLLRGPEAPGEVHLPGGHRAAVLLSGVGFLTTVGAIVLALFPAEEEPHKAFAVSKVVGLTALMLGAGFFVYRAGRRRATPSAGLWRSRGRRWRRGRR
ncbi:MAG: APC family permease [Thermoanaerobaculia bacterium]